MNIAYTSSGLTDVTGRKKKKFDILKYDKTSYTSSHKSILKWIDYPRVGAFFDEKINFPH